MGRLSIVIPTFNRRERLGRVLRALEGQSVEKDTFEVVVVDDGSSDQTAEWLEQQKFDFTLRVLRQANGGPAAARNAGVAASNHSIVLFLDDDVVPSSDLVREHLATHDAERDVVVIGPLSSLETYRQPWVAWEQAKLEAQYAAMTRGDYAPSFRQFWTGNASVAKEHVLAAGGFDTSLLRGEDVELGLRMKKRGISFRFNPRAAAMHHAERSLDSWALAHSSYGKLEVELFTRMGAGEVKCQLGENWRRLHPLNRWLVRRCVGRSVPFATATTALRGILRLGEVVPARVVSKAACSVLANLLYWDASAQVLGGTAIREVFRERAE